MKHKAHRLGVSEVNLVHRHLVLLRPIDTAKLNAVLAEIDQLYGLDAVSPPGSIFPTTHPDCVLTAWKKL